MSGLVVPCLSRTTVTATAPLTHLCPHVDEVDNGTVTLKWRTKGSTLELHALGEFLGKYADRRISHEELTELIALQLRSTEGLDLLSVSTTWVTAGMQVVVSS